ncbi:hypothetical protein [Myroides sp. DF42-4-2]|uniref:hypothetical protein n=1 Tax=unclassified Myroides TaxID=2642485 RepID=UPI002578100B|nr:hypothetical protein [Myroides sp. DF42-4-2]MDM1408778.1 hypothetical protein [Myroides sp. DF42-4-2]
MIKKIMLTVLILLIYGCKGQEKEISAEREQDLVNQEKEKVHWQDLPQQVFYAERTEVMEMRTKENQQKLAKIWDGFWRIETIDCTKEFLTMEEINLTNDLYYQGLKSLGFRFPSEAVFASRIKEIFDVDIYADYTDNPRIIKMEDYLILRVKTYPLKFHKLVPTLDFAYDNYVFDLKRHFLTSIEPANAFSKLERDDFDELYYIYFGSPYELALNNFIFHDNKAAFVYLNKSIIERFDDDFGYENFSMEYDHFYQEILRNRLLWYKSTVENTREGWDYRMYDRLFFCRGFDGKLIVKKKMLAAAVELAKEDEAYIRVPLDYYFTQMTTEYIPNEYAADQSEVSNYFKEREPYYTPEERAMIWVYTSLLELNLPPSETRPAPYMFIGLTLNYPELAQVAEQHNYFGEDMSEVLNILDRNNGWW